MEAGSGRGREGGVEFVNQSREKQEVEPRVELFTQTTNGCVSVRLQRQDFTGNTLDLLN